MSAKINLCNKHVFAFYKENISDFIKTFYKQELFEFKDKNLWIRFTKIIRFRENDEFILFDDKINITLKVHKNTFTSKNIIIGTITTLKDNVILSPPITLFLPLLKKEYFEKVIYASAQMGVNQIIPIQTDKTKKYQFNKKEHSRLHKIIISGCEQSKNFSLPTIHTSQKLETLDNKIKSKSTKKICFQENGNSLFEGLNDIQKNKYKNLIVTLGPEGGFTSKEIQILEKNKFDFYKLTPTILRSCEAAIVGIGCIRSIF